MTSMVAMAQTIPDLLVFAVGALMIVGGALGVIAWRNPVYAALSLVLTLFGIAVLFIEQQADFLAAVQIIVYAGAIVVLFLFVIMLLGVDRPEGFDEPLRFQRPIALGLGAGAEVRRPLGLAVVGGLLLSQFLTLYLTPVVYIYLDRFTQKEQAAHVTAEAVDAI